MKKLALTLIASAILLSACNDNDKKNKVVPTDTGPQVNQVFADMQGTWEQPGTGDIWVFEASDFTAYNFSHYGCVETETKPLTDIEDIADYLTVNTEKSLLSFDVKATSIQVFNKTSSLRDACQKGNLITDTSYQATFDYVWHTLNDYYAFFEQRGIDWQEIYDEFSPFITNDMTESEFLTVIEEIFQQFGDGHLSLMNKEGTAATGHALNGYILEVLRSDLVDAEEDFDEAYDELLSYRAQVLSKMLQQGELQQLGEFDAIQWGQLTDKTGYIMIERLQDLAENSDDEDIDIIDSLQNAEQDLTDIDLIMQTMMADLQHNDSLIIDLRFNGGGYDNVAKKIASYFTDQKTAFGTKHIANKSYQGELEILAIEPSPIAAFKKPVYVITGRSTGSAAEVLSMALKAIPSVTMIGEATNGSVSDELSHTLPNGWTLTLSNEVYQDQDKVVVEQQGIAPDIALPVYASQDLMYYSDTPIDHALQLAGDEIPFIPSEEDITDAFEEYFPLSFVPGIAVAVIKDGRVVFEHVAGKADIENDIPVTINTPFNVGSISKAVLASAIMQLVEKEQISLEDKLTDMSLSFDPNNPLNPEKNLALRHLVTHTSGIKDSEGYGCSYFVHESGNSLFFDFGVGQCPEKATTDTETFFAIDYFSPNGKYVAEGIFLEGDEGLPGVTWHYSNVASGLAAFAIEQKLSIDLDSYMQSNIFTPLSMSNTQWDHTNLSTEFPKAIQYSIDGDNELHRLPEYSYPTRFDGDLNISANDLARFLITVTNGGTYQNTQILSQSSIDNMLSSQTDAIGRVESQGVFWYWNGPFVGHGGGDPGTNALMHYNATTKTGIVILMNGEDESIGNDNAEDLLMPINALLYRYGLDK